MRIGLPREKPLSYARGIQIFSARILGKGIGHSCCHERPRWQSPGITSEHAWETVGNPVRTQIPVFKQGPTGLGASLVKGIMDSRNASTHGLDPGGVCAVNGVIDSGFPRRLEREEGDEYGQGGHGL